jgi:hypothetical protein
MKRILLAGILGGLVLFIWSAISWMVLLWHNKTLHAFKDDAFVSTVLKANVYKSGVYLLPSNYNEADEYPLIFASVSLDGMRSMKVSMLISFLIQTAAALLLAYLLSKTSISAYKSKINFIMTFALAVSILTYLPLWNWWGFEINYVIVSMIDMLIGFMLAGFAIAFFVNPL